MDYPEEWNQLPRHERRKKLKALRKQQEKKANSLKKMKNTGIVVVAIIVLAVGYRAATKKSPEQVELEQKIEEISLDGKVESFAIEGDDHVSAEVEVKYTTNPPTSGDHLAQAKTWGVYNREIDDKAGVHSLEHGGIWISYKDISEEDIKILEEIGRANSQSTVVSLRLANDDKIVIASWGKMMKLESIDRTLIQKYIDTHKNQSPEKLAL